MILKSIFARPANSGSDINVLTRQKSINAKLASAIRPCLEILEYRRLLAASVFVGENLPTDFTITTDTAPVGLSNGDTVTWNPGGTQHAHAEAPGLTFGTNAFMSVSDGVAATDVGGTLFVEAGTYSISDLTVDKAVTLMGAKSGLAGTSGSRGTGESALNGPAEPGAAINLSTSSAVVIDGFEFNGAKILAGQPGDSNLTIKNNVMNLAAMSGANQTNMIFSNPNQITLANNKFTTTGENPSNSAVMQVAGNYSGTGSTINNMTVTGNTFIGIPSGDSSTLQLNFSSVQGLVQDNTFDNVDIGLLIANDCGNLAVNANTFKNITRGPSEIAAGSFGAGILIFTPHFIDGPVTISNNTFQNSDSGIRASNAGGTLAGASLSIAANTFTGNVFHIVDKIAGEITLAGSNKFPDEIDGANTLASASTVELFAVEDKIVDAIDVASYGLVRLKANNVYVTPNSYFAPGGTTTPEIQRGVDPAAAGDTVNVANGTYTNQVDVAKNLTLLGQSQAGTTIKSPATLTNSFVWSGITYKPIISAHAANVVVQQLTIDGDSQGAANNRFTGIGYYNTGGTVDHVTVVHMHDNPLSGVQHGYGIIARTDDAAVRSVTISNNVVSDYQKNGVDVRGTGLTADITANTLTGSGPTSTIAQNGIVVIDSLAHISGNTISGNQYNPTTDDATGILLFPAASGTTVTGNTIDGNDVGIYSQGNGITISNNALGSNVVGIDVDGGTVAISGNDIHNNTTGIRVRNAGSATLTSNTFNGNGIGLLAQVGTATITNTQRIDGVGIGNGGFVTVVAGSNTVLITTSLTVTGSGKLDLNDNDMIVDYAGASQRGAIQALINSGRAGGTWLGNGITSTNARNASPANTTLGVLEATEFKSIYGAAALFDGQAIDTTAVLVKYTYYGDTDFNGKVNFDDYVRTDNGFNNHLSGWLNGDFDGNGSVNFDDYVLIDLAFNTQSGTLGRTAAGGSGSARPAGGSKRVSGVA
jgi:parallel beta-helix repeat protein